MRVRALLACLAVLAAVGTPRAQADPVIITLGLSGFAISGQTVGILVTARDPDASMLGVAGDGFAMRACRLDRRGRPATTGAFAPGRAAGFGLPYVPGAVGVHVAEVDVVSGNCWQTAGTTTRALTITVTLPPLLGRAAQADCPGADAEPAAGNAATVRAAILCLLNANRATAGLKPLREDRRLRRAATRHSRDMVRRQFFDHIGPGGPTLLQRLKAVHAALGTVGENIGEGSGGLATPASMVDAWMHSDLHRANILARRYHRVGIGIAPRDPQGAAPGGTFTTDFGG